MIVVLCPSGGWRRLLYKTDDCCVVSFRRAVGGWRRVLYKTDDCCVVSFRRALGGWRRVTTPGRTSTSGWRS